VLFRSVLIAVGAATAALWAGLSVRGPIAAIGASLIMGVAVTAMHYTGMRAAEVKVASETVATGHVPAGGATAMAFILPMIVCLGSALFLTSAFVALSPTASGARTPPARNGAPLAPQFNRASQERHWHA